MRRAFSSAYALSWRAAQTREEVDRLAPRQVRPYAHIAGDVRDAPVDLDGVAPRLETEDGCLAPGLARESQQDPDRGGLARPVGSEEPVHLALVDGEVESVEGVDAAVVLGEAARADDCGHGADGTPDSQIPEYPSRF